MISFKFFLNPEIRQKLLKYAFNPGDFTESELKILFSNISLIKSEKFVGETFRLGALSYLQDHAAEYVEGYIKEATEFSIPNPFSVVFRKLVKEKSTIAECIEAMEQYKDPATSQYQIKSSGTTHCISEPTLREMLQANEDTITLQPKEKSKLLEISEYLALVIANRHLGPITVSNVLNKFSIITGSIDSTVKLFSQLKDSETLELAFEQLGNMSWQDENSTERFAAQSEDRLEFWRKFIELKGPAGFGIALTAFEDSRVTGLLASGAISTEGLNEANIDAVALEIEKSLTSALKILDEVNGIDSKISEHQITLSNKEKVTLVGTKLQALAAKYKMPESTATKLVEDSGSFDTVADKVKDEIGRAFKQNDSGDFVIPLNLKIGGKAVNIKLHTKTDPTALFVGKMTACCQFYTGHSSEQAVLPVFKDPNAGLVTISTDNGKVCAASFIWLARYEDKDGKESVAVVMDSFEYLNATDAEKFASIASSFAKSLDKIGVGLFVGTGGKTPKLYVGTDEEKTIDRPLPFTKDFQPYGDSAKVYRVKPDVAYRSVRQEDEVDYVKKFFEGKSFEEVMALLPKFSGLDSLVQQDIAKICIKTERSFDEVAKDVVLLTGQLDRVFEVRDWLSASNREKLDLIIVNKFHWKKPDMMPKSLIENTHFLQNHLKPCLVANGLVEEARADEVLEKLLKISLSIGAFIRRALEDDKTLPEVFEEIEEFTLVPGEFYEKWVKADLEQKFSLIIENIDLVKKALVPGSNLFEDVVKPHLISKGLFIDGTEAILGEAAKTFAYPSMYNNLLKNSIQKGDNLSEVFSNVIIINKFCGCLPNEVDNLLSGHDVELGKFLLNSPYGFFAFEEKGTEVFNKFVKPYLVSEGFFADSPESQAKFDEIKAKFMFYTKDFVRGCIENHKSMDVALAEYKAKFGDSPSYVSSFFSAAAEVASAAAGAASITSAASDSKVAEVIESWSTETRIASIHVPSGLVFSTNDPVTCPVTMETGAKFHGSVGAGASFTFVTSDRAHLAGDCRKVKIVGGETLHSVHLTRPGDSVSFEVPFNDIDIVCPLSGVAAGISDEI